jgi:hypothetical protein
MTWLAIVTISLAVAIFLVGQSSKGKPKRFRGRDIGRSYESRYRATPAKGDDMKKWRDADYSR